MTLRTILITCSSETQLKRLTTPPPLGRGIEMELAKRRIAVQESVDPIEEIKKK
jgi:hypothetical protein